MTGDEIDFRSNGEVLSLGIRYLCVLRSKGPKIVQCGKHSGMGWLLCIAVFLDGTQCIDLRSCTPGLYAFIHI